MTENVSTKYFANFCPSCEVEISGFKKFFKGKVKSIDLKCKECKSNLIIEKQGKYFAIDLKKQFTLFEK